MPWTAKMRVLNSNVNYDSSSSKSFQNLRNLVDILTLKVVFKKTIRNNYWYLF